MQTFIWIISIISAIMAPFINERRARKLSFPRGDHEANESSPFGIEPPLQDMRPPKHDPSTYQPSPYQDEPLPYCPDPLVGDCRQDPTGLQLNLQTSLQAVNRYRKSHGRQPVLLNDLLIQAAERHARDLSRHDRISHYGSDGSDPAARVARTGYHAGLVAENVGTGQKSFNEVFQGWKDSPGHNENLLLREAREVGMALVTRADGEFKTFWVQVFGTSIRDLDEIDGVKNL